jgi:hypothetical protein
MSRYINTLDRTQLPFNQRPIVIGLDGPSLSIAKSELLAKGPGITRSLLRHCSGANGRD